jgi:hypothetical protein
VGNTVLVILVLAIVMAATIAIALIVLRRVGDKAERRADELRAEVAARGEEWEIPLGGATYQGGASAVRSRGHGVLGLTDSRILFLPIAGEPVRVPRARVSEARVEDRRREAAAPHRHRLVLTLDDGSEVSFLVDDAGPWGRALGGL